MPLYEYECCDCGQEFEVLVLSSGETVKCVSCSSENIGKLFSAFGVGGGDSDSAITESGDSGCCPPSSSCCCC